jgi:hypothetical protein
MEITRGSRTGLDGSPAPFAFVRLRDETRLRGDWVLSYFLGHYNSYPENP